MKKISFAFCACIVCILFIISSNCYAQKCPVKLAWNLPNEFIFNEVKASAKSNAGYSPVAKKGEKLYRYIRMAEYNYLSQFDFAAYQNSWQRFYSETDTTGISSPELRRRHVAFLQDNNPALYSTTHVLGPQITFNFSSCRTDSIKLANITIETLDWVSYPGGGFAVESKSNDIVLSTKKGNKNYLLDQPFAFKGRGSLDLRFFTDHFFRQNGMAPIGHFLIKINFNFLINSKLETVSTAVFKIDA